MDIIKITHVSFAALSLSGFILRGIWMLQDSRWIRRKPVRIIPHVIDTVLLASAVILVVDHKLDVLATPWLMAKIIGMLFYIALGVWAFRFARQQSIRILVWLAAILVFGYIVAIAVSKQPLPFI